LVRRVKSTVAFYLSPFRFYHHPVNISIIPTAMTIMLKIQIQVHADDLEGVPLPPEKESGGSPIDTLEPKRPVDM